MGPPPFFKKVGDKSHRGKLAEIRSPQTNAVYGGSIFYLICPVGEFRKCPCGAKERKFLKKFSIRNSSTGYAIKKRTKTRNYKGP